uniref:Envelope glycoprotein n=1 Tax=Cyprinodon variegatus TaxID=28743 RepID=A0A3Q2CDF8_CYPVA
MSTFSLPPVVQKPANLIFPFCIARGKELEEVTKRTSGKMWTADRLVTCSNRTWFPPTEDGNSTHHIRFCKTSLKATIRCEQVIPDGGHVIYEFQPSSVSQYRILNMAKGSAPLGDIFWMCHNKTQMLATLPPLWEGICAPVMLTGQLKLIVTNPEGVKETSNEITNHAKRSTSVKHEWKASDEVYITWDQIPYGVPEEQIAIGSDWIESGRAAGAVPIWGTIVNAQYTARNSRWVNLLWYNQQRFINFTMKGMDLVKEQLHATSLKVLQNRFVLESRMAGDQGICDHIGEDCCTLIPMHTDVNGSLTGVLQEMKRMRDEHVLQSNWNTQLKGFWDWFNKLGWGRYLKAIGMALGVIILIILIVICCILPLIRGLVSRLIVSVTGHFPVVQIQLDQGI